LTLGGVFFASPFLFIKQLALGVRGDSRDAQGELCGRGALYRAYTAWHVISFSNFHFYSAIIASQYLFQYGHSKDYYRSIEIEME
jgi:hypothetical protein